MVDHVVTQDTLDLNPELVAQGVKLGETIEYPAKPDAAQTSEDIIAELQAENESLRVQLSEVGNDYTAIVADIKAENESLQEQITAQDSEIESLHIQLKEAQEIAQDALQGYNTTAVQVANNLETEVDGKKVQVNFGVHHNGTHYTAADLVENPEVVAELLAIGSGSITLLEN